MDNKTMDYEIKDIRNLTNDQLKLLQAKNLEILKYFAQFCIEHDLLFYFCGGCLIGSLRHKGFVPWDDDVDVFMPRNDYEKLKELWPLYADTTKYAYCRSDENNNYHHAATSIKDINTTFINKHSQNEDVIHGIGIDVIPLDGYAPTKMGRYTQLYHAVIFSIYNTQRLPDNKGKLIRGLTQLAYILVPSKKLRYKIWKRAEKKMTKHNWDDVDYVTELIGSVKGMLLKHPKEWFNSSVLVNFEDTEMPIMKGYEQYLDLIFGDYMQLPPENERIAKHDTVYININEPYTKYKGIHYLK